MTADLVVAGHEVMIEVEDCDVAGEPCTEWSWWCRDCRAGGFGESQDEVESDAEGHIEVESSDPWDS